jgi:hypothetical protein
MQPARAADAMSIANLNFETEEYKFMGFAD